MAQWEATPTRSWYDATSWSNNAMNTRSATRDISMGGFTTYVTGSGSSVVGISVERIPAMREEIRRYCDRIERKLNELDTNVNPEVAFRSEEIVNALRSYLNTVKTYCINLTSNLLAFSDKLADVRDAWTQGSQSMASGINSSNSSVSSAAGSRYTETRQ